MSAPPLRIRPFVATDTEAVVALWQQCGLTRPWNDPHKDIARKLAVQPELFLVGTVEDRIVASVMAGYEGQRGCPKLNLLVRGTNDDVIAFYRALGYATDDAIPLGKRLIADEPVNVAGKAG
jgi:ribosomal protein S18 acetylase RimI-like enzyme